jgi:hypothetical protein
MKPVLRSLILGQDPHGVVSLGYAQVERTVLTAAQALAGCRTLGAESLVGPGDESTGDIRLSRGWGHAQSVNTSDALSFLAAADRDYAKVDESEWLPIFRDSKK